MIYILISIGLGFLAVSLFDFPAWVIPAVAFNNTTSLPLLLIQSLDATGILDRLVAPDEKNSDAIKRAKSYFLVCAIVGNCLTFAIGPRLIDAENSPDEPNDKDRENEPNESEEEEIDIEPGALEPDEHTSLLPERIHQAQNELRSRGYARGKKHWDRLSPRMQYFLSFCFDFFNAPLIGALIGALIGLIPPLHGVFFNPPQKGGVFNAWLTTSISNIGDLFASLQNLVVGVTLSSSLRKAKRGEDSGNVPFTASVFVIVVRFILWPVVSIAVIYALVTKTNWLSDDPILWFALMLMPVGPPSMKLVAMGDVNGADEGEKMTTAKFLTVSAFLPTVRLCFLFRARDFVRGLGMLTQTFVPSQISYIMSPLLAFAVVGSLNASEAAMS